jgi:hypothetical protein
LRPEIADWPAIRTVPSYHFPNVTAKESRVQRRDGEKEHKPYIRACAFTWRGEVERLNQEHIFEQYPEIFNKHKQFKKTRYTLVIVFISIFLITNLFLPVEFYDWMFTLLCLELFIFSICGVFIWSKFNDFFQDCERITGKKMEVTIKYWYVAAILSIIFAIVVGYFDLVAT